MEFDTNLVRGKLIRRYKRFLADILLDDGREVTAHCPNPGAMTDHNVPGITVWVEPNDNPRKKLKWGWRLVELDGVKICIDTSLANRIVGEGLRAGHVPDVSGDVRAEVKYGRSSRVDFLIETPEGQTFVEVKTVTTSRQAGLAEFPDCVTTRGAKHMDELAAMAAEGHRAMVLYLVQRGDCPEMAIADDLDPAYGAAARRALDAGVEMRAYRSDINTTGIAFGPPVAVRW